MQPIKRQKSRYNLPLNSIVFSSQVSLSSPRPTTAHTIGLVNQYDAQDTSVTALPEPMPLRPQVTVESEPHTPKRSVWHWVLGKIKAMFRHKKQQSVNVGSPMEFQHLKTGGAHPLRTGPYSLAVDTGGKKRRGDSAMEDDDDDESDWEDVEETMIFGSR